MLRGQTGDRVSAVRSLIPRTPDDIARLRAAFSRMVSKQWRIHVPPVLAGCGEGITGARFAKGRFIGEMYARACYSMLLVSRRGPRLLRAPLLTAGWLPVSRGLSIELGSVLIAGMERLLARDVHRQLLHMSGLMGMLDVVLDEAASRGEADALRVASLFSQVSLSESCEEELSPTEKPIVALARAARMTETAWQGKYWVGVLAPAVRKYCEAEVLGVRRVPDPTGMGHRSAGIEAVLRGMWYVAGPRIGLDGGGSGFEKDRRNREQQWMADTTLLMQMMDDWVDQDEDRGERLTPAVAGDWDLGSTAALFDKTVRDLDVLLEASGIRRPVLKTVLADLYRDYLHYALDAMDAGLAA